MPTFHLTSFGCRASQADGVALKRQLSEAGFAEAEDLAHSDVAVLNTCTVTATADSEVRQVIRRIHRQNPRCQILVTGCYAQRAPQEIAALDGVAWVLGNSHKHRVVEVLKSGMAGAVLAEEPPADPSGDLPGKVMVGEISPEFHFAPAFPDDRTRPTLKVQDGCNARCAFCIIPAVRGPSRSLPPNEVIREVQELERLGAREVVLSGINLGGYGRDLNRSITFRGLLERILSETSVARLRISSIEPMDVTPELIRLVAREKRLADHFHVPLQSGSDRVLRAMNRRYWTRQYAERILAIREALPRAGIGADVMVGFPGETGQDHQASAAFIDALPFTYLHIFPYSARPRTPAAGRPDQVNGRVARERGAELRAIIARKRQTFLESQVGSTLSALTLADGVALPDANVTAAATPRSRTALTSNYLPVSVEAANLPPNLLINLQVGRVSGAVLYGFAVRAA